SPLSASPPPLGCLPKSPAGAAFGAGASDARGSDHQTDCSSETDRPPYRKALCCPDQSRRTRTAQFESPCSARFDPPLHPEPPPGPECRPRVALASPQATSHPANPNLQPRAATVICHPCPEESRSPRVRTALAQDR